MPATPMTAGCRISSVELSTRSPEFGAWWAAHNVRNHRTGTKRFATRSSVSSSSTMRSWTCLPMTG